MKDYSKATLQDVAEIVETVRALRTLHAESHVQTKRTQSQILRQLPPDVLVAVARELAPSLTAVLSGETAVL